jgi:hypothetical protein
MTDTGRWLRLVSVAALVSVTGVAAGYAQSTDRRRVAAVAEFDNRLAAYVVLQTRAAAGLPPLARSVDPAAIVSRETALGDAIRAGRRGARRGSILTPPVARVFRQIIKRDFRSRTLRGQKVVQDDIPHFHPRVNQTYPSAWPLATFPPPLLAALPALPPGLEYRLLSDALVLHDVTANIIVDFMLDVF